MAAYEAGGGNNEHTVYVQPPPQPTYTGKPKSRIVELPQTSDFEPTPADAPPTPVEEDDHDLVYNTDKLKPQPAARSNEAKALLFLEWLALFAITALLISSLTVKTLKRTDIWSLELWKLCVLVLVVFCGRLITEWLTTTLVIMSERNFLLQTKLLYFIFSMKKSVRVVMWLALILTAWVLLVNGGKEESRRSRKESRVLSKITRGIVSTLVGAVLWMVKTLFVKLVASVFQSKTFFDRIQDLIINHHILQKLAKNDPKKKEGLDKEVNVEKLYKIKRENVSAWTMEGLMNVVTESDSLIMKTEVAGDQQGSSMAAVTREAAAVKAGGRIFKKVAKTDPKFIKEDDLLRYLAKEDVENAFRIFDGAAESRKIEESAFTNWVAKTYNERKCLAIALGDGKTAIEELNKIASCFVLILIFVVWILIMDIVNTSVLVFISSQLLILVFMFGNSAKILFEAMIFVFVVHPIDVGDRCVIDGEQMVVEEMNILTTIFLKANNEKLYYPNSVLATKAISNYNRSPEMMVDVIEFTLDFSTSRGSLDSLKDLKTKIKSYLDDKPEYWRPQHSVQVKDIPETNKMLIALFVTHTMNFQKNEERGIRKSELVIQLQIFREEVSNANDTSTDRTSTKQGIDSVECDNLGESRDRDEEPKAPAATPISLRAEGSHSAAEEI